MTDDLVKRLREVGGISDDGATRWYINPDGPEAADRIEKLTAALQEFIDPCIEHCFDTCQSECDPMKDCPCFKARKALEGKDD